MKASFAVFVWAIVSTGLLYGEEQVRAVHDIQRQNVVATPTNFYIAPTNGQSTPVMVTPANRGFVVSQFTNSPAAFQNPTNDSGAGGLMDTNLVAASTNSAPMFNGQPSLTNFQPPPPTNFQPPPMRIPPLVPGR